ncbi:hypothetical protein SAMN02982985_02241 [Rugamonas rubra]|uniref:Type III secretion protein (HrpB4) n=2 Tax=Rugamonas rubra TaxID=758825 RepID=A0A1I4M4Q3_9BURK|nr:hypothetical protein SAMN02982985_02241 [Rugamonas rubra]
MAAADAGAAGRSAPLADDFVDWWFAPWRHAALAPAPAAEPLARRDGYRLWCRRAGIAAELPAAFDPAWQVAAGGDGATLRAAARLFAGLLAARAQRAAMLGELSPAERKWCLGVAATQPLLACAAPPYAAGDALEVAGLVELARRLEPRFAGLWPRLRLGLPAALAARVDALLPAAAGQPAEASPRRAQRCWRLCLGRLAAPL